MFAEAIQSKIHGATWAVLGYCKDLFGQTPKHRGTAFSMTEDGYLMTCWHVRFMDKDCTIPCDSLRVIQPEIDITATYVVEVVREDREKDLCVLKIQEDVTTSPVQCVEEGEIVPFGSSCATFGHPLSVESDKGIRLLTRASGGIVSMHFDDPLAENGARVSLYELDLFAHGGISGGPAFLRDGRVFGVVSRSRLAGTDQAGQPIHSNLSIAVDAREAVSLVHLARTK